MVCLSCVAYGFLMETANSHLWSHPIPLAVAFLSKVAHCRKGKIWRKRADHQSHINCISPYTPSPSPLFSVSPAPAPMPFCVVAAVLELKMKSLVRKHPGGLHFAKNGEKDGGRGTGHGQVRRRQGRPGGAWKVRGFASSLRRCCGLYSGI